MSIITEMIISTDILNCRLDMAEKRFNEAKR